MRFISAARLLFAAVLTVSAGSAFAATITSNTGFGLDWNTPATWQGGVVPAPGDDVVIQKGSDVTIAAATTATVLSVTVQGGATASPSEYGTLTVAGTLTVTATTTVAGGTPSATGSGGSASLSVGGTLNTATLNVTGGNGTASGTGGTAALNLTATAAAVNVSANATLFADHSVFVAGMPSITWSNGSGTLDVNGALSVLYGTLTMNAGALKLAGDFVGQGETIAAGSGTITLDGNANQNWSGAAASLYNLTITNASADVNFDNAAVTLDASVDITGTLALSGGIVSTGYSLSISSSNGITRTSGHVNGSLGRNVSGNIQYLFPVGTSALYLPATVTPSTTGFMTVHAFDDVVWGAGPNTLSANWAIDGDQTLTTIEAVTFSYNGATVNGTEANYVLGRLDYYAFPQTWTRYATTLNTATDTASMASPGTTMAGYWTLGETASVTHATQIAISSVNDGNAPKKNTPFDLVYQAQDGQGNPATFADWFGLEIALGSTPAPTGTLTDVTGAIAPIGADANPGEQYILIPNLVYSAAETVTLQLSDPSAYFATVSTSVTFAAPDASLTVTSTEDDGAGTLRNAIYTANLGGCSATPCPIGFNLPIAERLLDNTWTIGVATGNFATIDTDGPSIERTSGDPLPPVNVPVILDGTTQPGFNAADPHPVITIDGGGGADILFVNAQGSTIRGLAFANTNGAGLTLQGTGSHVVEGCQFGITAGGAANNDTAVGIVVDSANNTIGGTSAAQRNVVSGNWGFGIELLDSATQNLIKGNYIGTDRGGANAVANTFGIGLTLASRNVISGNLIAGNGSSGILIDGDSGVAASSSIAPNALSAASENKIEGNTIGYNASGALLLNGAWAIEVSGDGALDTVIGGPTVGQGNTLAGGVYLYNQSLGTAISGNTHESANGLIAIEGIGVNDPGDVDVNVTSCLVAPCPEANNGQNAPEIAAATLAGGNLSVQLSVDSEGVAATQSIRVEVFRQDAAGTLHFIGNGCYDTNLVSGVTINVPSSGASAGDWIYAAATSFDTTGCAFNDQSGNHRLNDGTSTFSAPVQATACTTTTPTITASGSTTFCTGGSVTLTASAGASFAWKKNGVALASTGQTLVVTSSGSYSVVVTDASGCSAESAATTVTVTAAPAAPTISASGSTTFCSGGSVVLTSSAATNNQWLLNGSPIAGATAQSYTATTGGNYSVTVDNGNNCTATSTAVTVTVNATPATPAISANGSTTFCTGGSVTLTSSAASNNQWLLNGSPISGATAQSYTATTGGNYAVRVDTGNGCTATAEPVTVTVSATAPTPTISANGPLNFCTGGSVVLTSSAASNNQWLLDGTPISGANAQSYTATIAGNYSVTVDNGNGCSATSSIVPVIVETPPATPAVTTSGSTTFCTGGSVVLTSSAASNYQWLLNGSPIFNANAQSYTATASGNYSVRVANSGGSGCTSTSAATSVTVNNTPSPTVTANGATAFCNGGSVTLSSSATSGTYQWNKNGTPIGGANAASYVASVAGNYTVTVTENGCPATSEPVAVTTTAFTPTINAPSTTLCSGGSILLTASNGTSYQWYFNQQQISGATAQTYTATQPGDYKVYVESNGCANFTAPVTLTQGAGSTPTVTASGPVSFCSGDSVTLTSSAAQSYQWSRNGLTIANATLATYVATVGGNYTVTTTEAGGCVATSAPVAVTVTATPTATIDAPLNVQPNSTGHTASIVDSVPAATYNWAISGGTIDGPTSGTSITFSAGMASNVTLTVTAAIGNCSTVSSKTISVATAGADVAITKSAPASVQTGATIEYTLTVTNNGPAPAVNLYLSDPLPAGTTFVSANSAWGCAFISGSVVCRRNDLAPGAIDTLTITVTAPQQAGTITNTAAVEATTADPSPANNSAAATTTITSTSPECPTAAPLLQQPINGATVTSPVTFTWTAVSGATSYEVWTGSTLAGTTSTTSLTAALSSGQHTWYVVAKLGSACAALTSGQRTITVTQTANCSANGTPQLTSPAPNTSVSSPVTFGWTSVANATGYRVWISVDGGALQDVASTTATSATVTVPSGSVTAFVDALFSGCPANRSTGISFTVPANDACSFRGIATPFAPANNATVNSSSVDFRWSPASSAKEYRLWASIDGGAPLVLTTTSETSFRATIASGDVEWWVESLYSGCASTESAHLRFTIPAAQNCGTARPSAISPVNGTLTSGTVTFTWTGVAGAIGYELWLAHNDGTPTLVATTGANATSFTTDVPAGELDWFVRVLVDRCPPRDSQTVSFTYSVPVACDTNVRPVAITPVDGSSAISPVTFSWGGTTGATRFEVFTVRGNSEPSLVATAGADAFSAGNVQLPNGAMRWFVRAHYGNCPPLDSAEQQLQIVDRPSNCTVPAAPVVSAPGQVSSDQVISIQWTTVPAAASYQLQIAESADFAGAEVIATSDTSHEVVRNHNQPLLVLYARVRAVSSLCAGDSAMSAYSAPVAVFILPLAAPNGGTPATSRGAILYTIPLGPELAGQSFTAASAQPFITVTPASGVVPANGMNLTVSVDTSTLPLGTSAGSVSVTLATPNAGRFGSNGVTTVTTPVTVNLVTPVSPTPKNTPPPDALIIPAVAHANGINSQFQSDIRVSNTSPQLIKYQLTFTPSGDAGMAQGRQTTFSIDPGRTVALDDVLKSWFGTGTDSVTGTLEVRPLTQTATSTSSAAMPGLPNFVTFASSRTFNVTPNGTYGQFIPAIPFASFIDKSKVLSLQQIAHSTKYRTNLGLVEGSGEPATLLVKVFGSTGNQLAQFPVSLNGGQHLQLNGFIAQQGISSLDDGRVEVSVTGGNGKVTAYASVLDNATSDPLLVTPVTIGAAGNSKWVIPGVADLSNGTANWQSDIRLFNAGTTPADLTVSFVSQNGGEPKSVTFALQPGEVRQLDRALSALFGVTQDGGAMHIATAEPSRLVATARTYNQTTQGTYGQFISAVTPEESVAVGSRPLQLLQVEESSRYRSNIGLAETTGKPVTLEVTVVPPDSKFTATAQVTLAANEFRQITSLLSALGLGETYNARVTVKAVSGEGRATAYASVIDQKTQDPTYVPAQ